jgi:hypothetical protein
LYVAYGFKSTLFSHETPLAEIKRLFVPACAVSDETCMLGLTFGRVSGSIVQFVGWRFESSISMDGFRISPTGCFGPSRATTIVRLAMATLAMLVKRLNSMSPHPQTQEVHKTKLP